MRSLALFCIAFAVCACDRWEQRLGDDPQSLRVTPPPHAVLPDSAFRVRWNATPVPREVASGSELDVPVSLTNVSDQFWPGLVTAEPEKRDGSYAVRLAYQWIPAGTTPAQKPLARADFPFPPGPGDTTAFLVNVRAPAQPGEYELRFELLQELVAWFDAKGAPTLSLPVRVTGAQ